VDEHQPEERTPDVEDLDVPEEEAEDVKGGFFTKISGIKGESGDSKHKGDIDI
jgi:hypothetical protein